MKAKMSFNSKAIQEFLFAHVEKFAFGLIAVVMLFFITGAMDRPGYERTPEELLDIAKKADERIEATPAPPDEQRYNNSVEDRAELIRIPVEADPYQYSLLWTPFIWPKPATRDEPQLFTVQELRGEAGHGAVRVKLSAANPTAPIGGVQGQRWVVITGLIPFKEQWDAYVEAFGEAEFQDPSRDIPKVIYYSVERAELQSPGDVGQPNWELLKLNTRLRDAGQLWNGTAPEVVNPKYIHRGGSTPIVFPLPPVDKTAFGREVVHHPQIPLAIEEEPEELLPEEDPTLPGEDEPPLEDLPPEMRVTVVEAEKVEEEVLEYALYRFFDLEVEPGKHYMYRVQLWLENPNYGVERRFLARDGLRDAQWLKTPWSDPTEVISVPRDARVLVASVKPTPGGRVTMEPKATVGIPYFYFEKGVELFERHEVLRGRYLNFPEREVPEESLPGAMPSSGYGYSDSGESFLAPPPKAKSTGKDEEEPLKVDFNTETVLLDMAGGERLVGRDRDLTAPGWLLLLDPDGRLVVQNELDDKPEYDTFPPPEEKKPKKKELPMGEDEYYYEEGDYSDDSYEYEMMQGRGRR